MAKKTSTSGNPKSAQRRHLYTYWLTRDAAPDTGELSARIRVWLAKPERSAIGQGAVWMGPALEGDLYAEWDLGACLWWARVYPDDDRQCIRVEGDSIKAPTDELDPTASTS